MKKRYKSLFERRLETYKAWINPSSKVFHKFSANKKHESEVVEIAKENEQAAYEDGFYRVYVEGHGINIQAIDEPSDREFKELQDQLSNHTNMAKISYTWFDIGTSYTPEKRYFFPKSSFFFAKKIADGRKN